MLAGWPVLSTLLCPPVSSAGGVRLPRCPLHVVQLTQEAQIPELMRPLRVDMVYMVAGGTTERAAAVIAADDGFPDLLPVLRELVASS